MNTFASTRNLWINGGLAGVSALDAFAKDKIVALRKSGNVWSSTEYSAINGWNVNFNNGNSNGNNKYNSNAVRPSAALTTEMMTSVIDALYDCCRNKRSSEQCVEYLIDSDKDIMRLAREIYSLSYSPGVSLCFGVQYPNLREIFAASFRDRIAQHWVTIRLEPMFEQLFHENWDVSYNCRKGFGTQRAVLQLASDICRVSYNYTQEAFVGHYDVQAFFNSIDKHVLWNMLSSFIDERYHGWDKDVLRYMVNAIVMHRPCDDCIETGGISILDRIPRHKRMKYRHPYVGMAIGNITSQLFANFFLNALDSVVMQEVNRLNMSGEGVVASYIRFADDIAVVTRSKKDNLMLRDLIDDTLQERCHLSIHPDKVYLQECRHGVKYCGYFIKPGRIYLSNRTFQSLSRRLIRLEQICSLLIRSPSRARIKELHHLVAGANSIIGFTSITSSYAIRRSLFAGLSSFWKVCYVIKSFQIIKIHKKYRQ